MEVDIEKLQQKMCVLECRDEHQASILPRNPSKKMLLLRLRRPRMTSSSLLTGSVNCRGVWLGASSSGASTRDFKAIAGTKSDAQASV